MLEVQYPIGIYDVIYTDKNSKIFEISENVIYTDQKIFAAFGGGLSKINLYLMFIMYAEMLTITSARRRLFFSSSYAKLYRFLKGNHHFPL